MSKPPRPRTRVRAEARAARNAVKQTERWAALMPGGAADHPIEVTSGSVVEVRARAALCHQCQGELELRGDSAVATPRGVLREVDMVCRRCHAAKRLWFRVVSGLPS